VRHTLDVENKNFKSVELERFADDDDDDEFERFFIPVPVTPESAKQQRQIIKCNFRTCQFF
jgi:hypothetical protein